MNISIGADHAGFPLKEKIKRLLIELDHWVSDLGTFSDEPVDYPDFAEVVARAVARGDSERGILVCGTGIGMAIAGNKVKGVRAATCYSLETARMSRRHNDSNVLALGGWVTDHNLALDIVKEWLETGFDGGRHQRRVDRISKLERLSDD